MKATNVLIQCLALFCLPLSQNVCTAADVFYPPVSESVERLTSSNEYAQERGISDLVGMGNAAAPAYDILIFVALSSNNMPKIRSGAVRALRNIDEAKASDQFIRELTNGSPSVREYAVDALMTITRPEAAIPLFYALRDENKEVRHRAAIALQFYKSDQLAELLIATLQHEEDPARECAPWLLGRMKRQDAIAPLTNHLNDDAPAFRKSVIAALRDIKSKESVPSLIAIATHDKDDDVRAKAIQCLGDLGDASASKALLECLTDPNPEIRTYAAGALGMLTITDAMEPLHEMFRRGSPREKLAAMGGLCMLGDQQAIPLIMSSIEEGPPELIPYFMKGLVELSAETEILSLQNHTNAAVRSAAQSGMLTLEKRKPRSSNKGVERTLNPRPGSTSAHP